jgi:hypothetical protein
VSELFTIIQSGRYVGGHIDVDLYVSAIRHPTSTSVIPISEENMSDIGYWINVYFDSDIMSNSTLFSPILEVPISGSCSPISLITDIGLSTHLWLVTVY